MNPITVLFIVLGAVTAVFCLFWVGRLVKKGRETTEPGTEVRAPNLIQLVIGFFTDEV